MQSNIIAAGGSLGADPEVMIWDNHEGRIVSALRVLKWRDKNKPIKFDMGKMYADNVLVECAFEPAHSIDEVMVRMRSMWGFMQNRLGDRYRLLPKSATVYHPIELRGKKPWETGCNPSFNAYSQEQNPIVKFSDGLRTGSFHLHLGHPKIDGRNSQRYLLVRLLDIFCGCASVLFDRDDSSPLRRALYGRAGEFRPTPYGLEYRVLGNWALGRPETTQLVWDLLDYAVGAYDRGEAKAMIEAVGEERPQSAINNHDRRTAENLLSIVGLPDNLMARVKATYPEESFNQAWGI